MNRGKAGQLFQVEVDEAHRQLKQASKALSDFMANAQTSTSGHYLLSSQEALWKLKQDRAFNVALRDENKGKIESLLKILETEQPTRMLKRGISEERDLLDLARKNDPEASLEDLLGLRIDVEHVNYAYDKARAELIDASKTYFGAIKHVEAMTAEIAEIEQEIRQAEQEMADKKRLENELEIAANNFREISAKNAETKTTIASERQDLVIVETAVLPEIPAGPPPIGDCCLCRYFCLLHCPGSLAVGGYVCSSRAAFLELGLVNPHDLGEKALATIESFRYTQAVT